MGRNLPPSSHLSKVGVGDQLIFASDRLDLAVAITDDGLDGIWQPNLWLQA